MAGQSAERAVLLVAHGSRIAASNTEITALARRLRAGMPDECVVAHAFLELASPSIPDAIDNLAATGISHLVLIPYFLSAGRHVSEDIPGIVDDALARHPGLTIQVTDHLGAQAGIPALLRAMTGEDQPR